MLIIDSLYGYNWIKQKVINASIYVFQQSNHYYQNTLIEQSPYSNQAKITLHSTLEETFSAEHAQVCILGYTSASFLARQPPTKIKSPPPPLYMTSCTIPIMLCWGFLYYTKQEISDCFCTKLLVSKHFYRMYSSHFFCPRCCQIFSADYCKD